MSRTLVTLLLTVFTFQSYSQISYYVNIGAFKKTANADRLVAKSKLQGYESDQAVNPDKQLHYVFVLSTSDKRKAYALAVKLRVESEYKDAWVYEGNLGKGILGNQPDVKLEPVVVPAVEEKTPEPVIEKPALVEPAIDSSKVSVPATDPKPPVVEEKPIPKGKPFYFRLRNSDGNEEIKSGEVQLLEGARATEYKTFKPGEVVYLEAPINKRGLYTIVTQVVGYRPERAAFNFKNPQGAKGSAGEAIIEISLVKAKKGDYVDFANVRFYENAAFMYAPSQNELDGLVDLMKENPRYEIRIHGHVNGNKPRETYTRGSNSAFFAQTPSADVTNKTMSAKELSLRRAETVRDYLISQGIEPKRISVKGQGGRIPLYPDEGTLSQSNDRVEIEITKGK
ncbi:MAG: OmpA family protein [Cytophagales bacterium]